MKYMFMGNSPEIYSLLEKIRSDAYGSKYISDFYKSKVEDGKILFAGAYLNDELVGGCFITDKYDSVFIEEIFVVKKYQNSSLYNNKLHIGSNLLKFILNNKEEIEVYFNKRFNYSKLEAASSKIEEFYKKLGYRSEEGYINMIKKI